MKKVIKINNEGFFLEDVILKDEEETPSDCIEVFCPEGFYKPKWIGTEWIEGLSTDEIEAIKNKQPKTEIEILKETVDMLVLESLGGF